MPSGSNGKFVATRPLAGLERLAEELGLTDARPDIARLGGFLLLGTAVYFARPFFQRWLASESSPHRASGA